VSEINSNKSIKKISNSIYIYLFIILIVTSLKPKGDRIDGEKFLQIMLERQKQLKLRLNIFII